MRRDDSEVVRLTIGDIREIANMGFEAGRRRAKLEAIQELRAEFDRFQQLRDEWYHMHGEEPPAQPRVN